MKKTIYILFFAFLFFGSDLSAKKPLDNSYYNNGNLKYSIEYLGGQMVCITSYYRNGSVKEKGHYRKGIRHGWFENFNHDGTRKTSAFFYNDERDGLWTFYEKGKVEKYVFFEKNEIVQVNSQFAANGEF